MGVTRSAKRATTPITSTVSIEPKNDLSAVAIDKRPNGTPQIQARMSGAAAPTRTATMSVRAIGYGALPPR